MSFYTSQLHEISTKACKLGLSPLEHAKLVQQLDANFYIQCFYSNLSNEAAKFYLSDNELYIEVLDKKVVSEYFSLEQNKLEKYLVLKSIDEGFSRIENLKKRAMSILPNFAAEIDKIPVLYTYLNPLNAGAMPTSQNGNAILLNDGIPSMTAFIKCCLEAQKSSVYEWKKSINDMIERTFNHYRNQGINIERKWVEEDWLKLLPQPTDQELTFKYSNAALIGFELLGMKPPPPFLVRRRSELDIDTFNGGIRFNEIYDLEGRTSNYAVEKVIEPFIFFHELGHILLGHTAINRTWHENKPTSLAEYKSRIEAMHEMEYEADNFALNMLLEEEEHNVDSVGGFLIWVFRLFLYSEIDFFKIADRNLKDKTINSLGIHSEFFDRASDVLRMRHSTHPSSVQRFSRLWSSLKKKQEPVNKDLERWWKSLNNEEQIIHIAKTGKGEHNYIRAELQDTELVCKGMYVFFEDSINFLFKRITEENESGILSSIPIDKYPFDIRSGNL